MKEPGKHSEHEHALRGPALESVLERLKQIRGVSYEWREDNELGLAGRELGVISAAGGRPLSRADLDALNAGLRAVVADAMQPAHVSLWLRGSEAGR